MPRKKNFDFLIAGAGLAGLSTAFFLAERGAGQIAVTEKEAGPGLAASAKSASMICQLVRDPLTCRLMIQSTRLLKDRWLAKYPDVAFAPCGSLHIGKTSDLAAFEASVGVATTEGILVERLSRAAAIGRFGALAHTDFEEALWCPSDGIVDTAHLIRRIYQDLLTRGVRFGLMTTGAVRRQTEAYEAEITPDNLLAAPVLVNAAGAWARDIARMTGASALIAQPMRRHVFVTAAFQPAIRLPIIWDVSRDIYVRPDGDAVMTSPCDEEPCEAGPTGVSDEALPLLEKKLAGFFPAILGARHTRMWSGLRTFSKDKKFVIGWDGTLKNFFWSACLGGYGVTAAAGCGDLAASLLTRSATDVELVQAFSPTRFNSGRALPL